MNASDSLIFSAEPVAQFRRAVVRAVINEQERVQDGIAACVAVKDYTDCSPWLPTF